MDKGQLCFDLYPSTRPPAHPAHPARLSPGSKPASQSTVVQSIFPSWPADPPMPMDETAWKDSVKEAGRLLRNAALAPVRASAGGRRLRCGWLPAQNMIGVEETVHRQPRLEKWIGIELARLWQRVQHAYMAGHIRAEMQHGGAQVPHDALQVHAGVPMPPWGRCHDGRHCAAATTPSGQPTCAIVRGRCDKGSVRVPQLQTRGSYVLALLESIVIQMHRHNQNRGNRCCWLNCVGRWAGAGKTIHTPHPPQLFGGAHWGGLTMF